MADAGSGIFTAEDPQDFAFFKKVEYDNWDIVFHAEREGGGVHDFELADEAVVEADAIVTLGVRVFVGVAVVDADNGEATGAESSVLGERRPEVAGPDDDDVKFANRLQFKSGVPDIGSKSGSKCDSFGK